MPAASIKRRERRVVAAGIAISVAALLFRFAILPFADRWSAREDVISSSADRIARMRALISDDARLRASLSAAETTPRSRQLVTGRTPALAGSALQAAIQATADRSKVSINRLDLAGAPDSSSVGLPGLPVTISAVGDIYGLSDFLSQIQYGTPVLQVQQLTIVSNSSLRGGLLQISLQLSAPAVIQ